MTHAAKISSVTTRDHDEIRDWVEERGGFPAVLADADEQDPACVLQIDFPGYNGPQPLKRVSWDDYFEKFDRAELAFQYRQELRPGEFSRFNAYVRREE
ncbi:MAG: hypothetical protein ACKOC5_00565 [Chloroflexota bacterium]